MSRSLQEALRSMRSALSSCKAHRTSSATSHRCYSFTQTPIVASGTRGGPSPPSHRAPQGFSAHQQSGREAPELPASAFFRSRWPYLALLGLTASAGLAYSVFREPEVTQRVWLEFEVDGRPTGSVTVGLFGREAPQTCDNFTALATHEAGFGYRGCPVHRVMPGWSVWGGDVTAGDGSGGASVFGPSFGVESMGVRHRRGTLSMVPDEDGRLRSQFFFTLVATPGLDRKAAAFGRVLYGIEVLERLSRLPAEADSGRPHADVRVRACGVLADGEEAGAAGEAGRGAVVERGG